MWALYMGHVVTVIGGVNVDFKTAEQSGPVYHPVPKAKQKAALQFLTDNAMRDAGLARTGRHSFRRSDRSRDRRRLGSRQAERGGTAAGRATTDAPAVESESLDEANAYPLTEYLGDLRRAVWGTPGTGAAPDAKRRTMQRVYLERLDALISPPAPPAPRAQGARWWWRWTASNPGPLLWQRLTFRGRISRRWREARSGPSATMRGRAAASAPAGVVQGALAGHRRPRRRHSGASYRR